MDLGGRHGRPAAPAGGPWRRARVAAAHALMLHGAEGTATLIRLPRLVRPLAARRRPRPGAQRSAAPAATVRNHPRHPDLRCLLPRRCAAAWAGWARRQARDDKKAQAQPRDPHRRGAPAIDWVGKTTRRAAAARWCFTRRGAEPAVGQCPAQDAGRAAARHESAAGHTDPARLLPTIRSPLPALPLPPRPKPRLRLAGIDAGRRRVRCGRRRIARWAPRWRPPVSSPGLVGRCRAWWRRRRFNAVAAGAACWTRCSSSATTLGARRRRPPALLPTGPMPAPAATAGAGGLAADVLLRRATTEHPWNRSLRSAS